MAKYRLIIAMVFLLSTGCMKEKSEIELLTEKANSGDLAAQVSLGEMYILGKKVPKDVEKGEAWFEKADNALKPEFKIFLARNYDHGTNGLPQDKIKAFKWFFRAANQNNAPAQVVVAARLILGDGVEPNLSAGQYWMQKAARNGNVEAANYLAQNESERQEQPLNAEMQRERNENYSQLSSSNERPRDGSDADSQYTFRLPEKNGSENEYSSPSRSTRSESWELNNGISSGQNEIGKPGAYLDTRTSMPKGNLIRTAPNQVWDPVNNTYHTLNGNGEIVD